MYHSPCQSALRCLLFGAFALIVIWKPTVLTASEADVQIRLHLQEPTSLAYRVYAGNSAQLTLRSDHPGRVASAIVNGASITLRSDQKDTRVELRFESCGAMPSVCRIQAGNAALKFAARPGQFYVCTVLTSAVNPAENSAVEPPAADESGADPGPVVATGNPALAAELTANQMEEKRLHAEAQNLQNELNQAEARKRNADAYQIEIEAWARKRDALIAVRDNFWILQRKTGGILDLPDTAGGTILSELRRVNEATDVRDIELRKLGPQIAEDNANANDIQARLRQIAAGRLQLEQRRTVLKSQIK